MAAAHTSDKEGRMPGIHVNLSPQCIRQLLAAALLTALMGITSSPAAVAQWLPDQRLTNDTAASVFTTTTAKAIAANGDSLAIVWRDARDGNNEIYFKQSRDGGTSWGPDIRLTRNGANSSTPCIAVQGPNIHVVWNDSRDGNAELYYLRSSDGGEHWSSETRLTTQGFWAGTACLALSGSMLHLVWRDSREGSSNDMKVYYKRSTDGGAQWGPDTRLSIGGPSFNPSAAVSGSIVHVVWNENTNGFLGLRYLRSTDAGNTWENERRIITSPMAQLPSIAACGSDVNLVWDDYRDGNTEIYHTRSTDDGANWETEARLSEQVDRSAFASLCRSGYNVHVAWEDEREGTPEIFYRRSTDGGANWEAPTRLTDNFGTTSERPSIAASKDAVHVVWMDRRDWPGGEIYYKRNPIGNRSGATSDVPRVAAATGMLRSYPNPCREATTFTYSLQRSGPVRLTVHDALGREVATVLQRFQDAGPHEIPFRTSALPPGLFHCRIETADGVFSRTLIRMK